MVTPQDPPVPVVQLAAESVPREDENEISLPWALSWVCTVMVDVLMPSAATDAGFEETVMPQRTVVDA
jgi:hypothetical protein